MERLSNNRIRKRTPGFIAAKEQHSSLFRDFNMKTPQEQSNDLIPFIIDCQGL